VGAGAAVTVAGVVVAAVGVAVGVTGAAAAVVAAGGATVVAGETASAGAALAAGSEVVVAAARAAGSEVAGVAEAGMADGAGAGAAAGGEIDSPLLLREASGLSRSEGLAYRVPIWGSTLTSGCSKRPAFSGGVFQSCPLDGVAYCNNCPFMLHSHARVTYVIPLYRASRQHRLTPPPDLPIKLSENDGSVHVCAPLLPRDCAQRLLYVLLLEPTNNI